MMFLQFFKWPRSSRTYLGTTLQSAASNPAGLWRAHRAIVRFLRRMVVTAFATSDPGAPHRCAAMLCGLDLTTFNAFLPSSSATAFYADAGADQLDRLRPRP
jgi:hypothetical protein